MGELMTQLLEDRSVGSFFRKADVVAAEAAVTDAAKRMLARIVSQGPVPCVEYQPGRLHHCIVHTLRAAFEGRVAVFFHDILIDSSVRDAAISMLRDIERRSDPPTCPLDHERLPLVRQLLAVAELSTTD